MLVPGMVASIFFIAWILMYPSGLWKSLTFRNHDGAIGIVVSMATWLFLCLFVFTIVEIAKMIP